jgi:hypothetical protein
VKQPEETLMKFGLAKVILVASLSLSGPARSETEDSELRAPAVVVTGARVEQAKEFVREIVPGGGDRLKGLPRWHSELCTGVIGVPADQGQFIADRISLRALEVGLPVGKPGCDTNLLIVISPEVDELLPRLVEEYREVFEAATDNSVETPGKPGMRAFLESDRAVRWWQVVERFTADGMPLDGDAYNAPANNTFAGSTPGGSGIGIRNAPTVEAASASRLRSNIRRQMSRIIVVVDAKQTAGLGIGAISDYLALVSLAQIDPEADVSKYPSILRLFTQAYDKPTGLTDWDRAFLSGLYRAAPNAVSRTMHISDIAGRMVRKDRTEE